VVQALPRDEVGEGSCLQLVGGVLGQFGPQAAQGSGGASGSPG
jgi:hypothetical protein